MQCAHPTDLEGIVEGQEVASSEVVAEDVGDVGAAEKAASLMEGQSWRPRDAETEVRDGQVYVWVGRSDEDGQSSLRQGADCMAAFMEEQAADELRPRRRHRHRSAWKLARAVQQRRGTDRGALEPSPPKAESRQ